LLRLVPKGAAGIEMTSLQKVLVVDNGERAVYYALSAELAEMGFASVTTPVEAADDVLALIPTPAAILVQIPSGAPAAERKRFMELAERLRESRGSSVPIIVVGGAGNGATSAILQSELGARILSKPEL
jgi:hypothetical protein